MPVPELLSVSVQLKRSLLPVAAPKVKVVVLVLIASERFPVGLVSADHIEEAPAELQAGAPEIIVKT